MADLISVIVPVYNVEKYLDRCITSIVEQTYTNLEIILIDDGSTDSSQLICDEWEKKDERIKVIHKQNGGLSDARNAGLKIASGNYISFIDSDDWIENDFYTILYNLINETACEIASCGFVYATEHSKVTEQSDNKYEIKIYNTTQALRCLIKNTDVRQVVWNKLYKKEIISGLYFPVGKYHEDEFWSYRAIGNADSITVTSYIGYNYFQRTGSIMGSHYSLKKLDAIEAKIERQEYLKEKFPDLVFGGKVDIFFSCLYQGQLAVSYLKKTEQNTAFSILKTVIKKYKFTTTERTQLTIKQKIWILMAHFSLKETCRIRHLLKIGY